MKKAILDFTDRLLSREQLKKVKGGCGSGCPQGQFTCTCNGTNYGCVSSVQACWDKC